MENKPVEAWKPEWNISQEVAEGTQGTLNYDAQKVTRTIRAKADTPDEINEMFDNISYGKAGAVLLMVENYLGEETFRQGVHEYLTAHLYGNATAEDFWTALAEVSHRPVDKIMNSLVSQPGVPLLTFGPVKDGKVSVSQKRFFLNGKNQTDTAEAWTLPVCFKTAGAPKCEVLSSAEGTLPVPSAPFFYANAGGTSYYRAVYPEDVYNTLIQHVETDLKPEERVSLLGDEWALMRSGKATVGAILDLAQTLSNDPNPAVLGEAVGDLEAVDARIAATTEERGQLAAWVRAHYSASYKKLGDPTPGDSPEKRELRASLLGIVAGIGEDPEAIAQARQIAAQSLADPSSVDQTLAQPALSIAAEHGDAAFFDQLQKLSTTATNPQLRSSALFALAEFHDPVLAKRALDYAASGKVRNQDAFGLFASEMQSRDTREQAWEYIQQNWEKVLAQTTEFGGAGLVGSTASFCSAEKLDEVTKFFATHKVKASERALTRAKNQIGDCIDLRAAQEGNLKAWLAKQ